jgi:hypothetical protein
MAYRFLNPAPVFFALSGEENANGGSLTFYDIGTTDPKDTWSDPAMGGGNLNSNPVELDSAGRSNVSIWLDGEYSVVLKDEAGVTVWTRDVTSGIAAGAAIPALVLGQYLTNDGTNLLWADVASFLLPDPSGSADYILSTDGANFIWIPQPEIPEVPDPEIVVTANSLQAGVSDDETKGFMQWGTASANASGTPTTTATVTFPVPFSTAPFVAITCTTNSQPGGPVVHNTTSAPSTTAFTAQFDVAEASGSGSANVVNAVPFIWFAIGTKEVAA